MSADDYQPEPAEKQRAVDQAGGPEAAVDQALHQRDPAIDVADLRITQAEDADNRQARRAYVGQRMATMDPEIMGVLMPAFTGPENTRIVFELSRPTAFVAPDSDRSRQVTITIPGEPVARAAGVAGTLIVRDGVVDSVQAERGPA